jgi:hypothetical protein
MIFWLNIICEKEQIFIGPFQKEINDINNDINLEVYGFSKLEDEIFEEKYYDDIKEKSNLVPENVIAVSNDYNDDQKKKLFLFLLLFSTSKRLKMILRRETT